MTHQTPEGPQKRSRGVRLTDLDRSKVYRIHHTGRRWEVLGPEDAPAAGAGPVTCSGASADDAVASTATGYEPRHAAPGRLPRQDSIESL